LVVGALLLKAFYRTQNTQHDKKWVSLQARAK
jgi:hypothetical protein